MITYLVVVRSHKSKLILGLNIISEATLVVLHCYSWLFMDLYMPDDERERKGIIMIIIVTAFLAACLGVAIYFTVVNLIEACEMHKRK